MNDFKIVYRSGNIEYIITEYSKYDRDRIDSSSTFDEKLHIQENEKIEFSFSLSAFLHVREGNKIKRHRNKNAAILSIGSTIQLFAKKRQYNLIISSITPEIKNKNLIYNYQAQDEASFSFSKKNVGYSYQGEKPESIGEIVNKIIQDNNWTSWWKVLVDEKLANKKITFSLSNSNLYNALLEVSYLTGSYIEFRYDTREIYYKSRPEKDSMISFRFKSSVDLREFSPTLDGDDLTSILRVTGGNDQYDRAVTIVPPMPIEIQQYILEKREDIEGDSEWKSKEFWKNIKNTSELYTGDENKEYIDYIIKYNPSLNNFLYNFEYFKKRKIINIDQYEDLINIIENIMGKNNLFINIFVARELRLKWQNQIIEREIRTEAESALAVARRSIKIDYEGDGDFVKVDMLDLKDAAYVKHISNINEIIRSKGYEYFKNLEILYGTKNASEYDEIKKYQEDAEYYDNEADKIEQEIEDLIIELNKLNKEEDAFIYNIQSSEIEGKINTLISYKSLSNNFYGGGAGINKIIYDSFIEAWEDEEYDKIQVLQENGVSSIANYYIEQNKQHWAYIYTNYWQVIYEGYYENKDELSPQGLYNQSIIFLEDMKQPLITSSLSVINISELIPMTVYDLDIGKKIKIYYDEMGFSQNDYEEDSYFHENLIITDISYEMRTSNVEMGVSQIKSTYNILDRILLETQ